MTRDRDRERSDVTEPDAAGPAEDDDVTSGTGTGTKPDASWPVELTGVTESLVTTRGPNGRWNVAPLGLFAGERVTAKTWGKTRTRRNFERTGEGYLQFTTDPVVFVDAALSVVELDEPVLDVSDAWVRVAVNRLDSGRSRGTSWVRWELDPEEARVRDRRVPTLSRAIGAVVEASVVASRLETSGFDTEAGIERIARAGETVDRTGDERTREAFDRLLEHAALTEKVDRLDSATRPDEGD